MARGARGAVGRAVQLPDVEQRQHADGGGGGDKPRCDAASGLGHGVRSDLCQVRAVRWKYTQRQQADKQDSHREPLNKKQEGKRGEGKGGWEGQG